MLKNLDNTIRQLVSDKDATMTGKNGKQKARDFAEVTTSIWLIDRQIRLLPQDVILDLSKTVLDPCTGDGRYLMRYLYWRLPAIKNDNDLLMAIGTLYGFELQGENVNRARQNLLMCVSAISSSVDLNKAERLITNNIQQGDFLEWSKQR